MEEGRRGKIKWWKGGGGKVKWWKGGTTEGGKKEEKVGRMVGRREEGEDKVVEGRRGECRAVGGRDSGGWKGGGVGEEG